jgi:DNA-binding Lrp family transcriptional regulator
VAERELEPAARKAISGLPGVHYGLAVFRELAGPVGIPDFLAVVGPASAMQRRLGLPISPLLNRVDAGIAAVAAPSRGKTIEQISEQLKWSPSTIERRMTGLLKDGVLFEKGQGRYVRPDRLVPTGRLYAIETKVSNFSRALKQARTYSLWCYNYVIVMPALNPTVLDRAITAVKADGGGLVVDGRWQCRPKHRPKSPFRSLWGSEHVIAAIRGYQPSV